MGQGVRKTTVCSLQSTVLVYSLQPLFSTMSTDPMKPNVVLILADNLG